MFTSSANRALASVTGTSASINQSYVMYSLYIMGGEKQDPAHAGGVGGQSLHWNADFARLWTGGAVSGLGSSMTTLVYPLLALSITSSAAAAGLLGLVALTVGAVTRLPAGVAIDRAPLRWMLVGSDLIRVVTTLVAATSLLTGHLVLWQLVVVAAVNLLERPSARWPTQSPSATSSRQCSCHARSPSTKAAVTPSAWPANRSVACFTASRRKPLARGSVLVHDQRHPVGHGPASPLPTRRTYAANHMLGSGTPSARTC